MWVVGLVTLLLASPCFAAGEQKQLHQDTIEEIARYARITADFFNAPHDAKSKGVREPSQELNELLDGVLAFLETERAKIRIDKIPARLRSLVPPTNPMAEIAERELNNMRNRFVDHSSPLSKFGVDLPQTGTQPQQQQFTGSRPLMPGMPSTPTTPGSFPNPFKAIASGFHKVAMALGQEGFGPLSDNMRRILELSVGFVPGTYTYNAFGAGTLENRHQQGAIASETNFCYALLETWMRSCSAPQLFFLQIDQIVSHVVDKATKSSSELRRKANAKNVQQACAAVLVDQNSNPQQAQSKDDGWGNDIETASCLQVRANATVEAQRAELSDKLWGEQVKAELGAISMLAHQVVTAAMQNFPSASFPTTQAASAAAAPPTTTTTTEAASSSDGGGFHDFVDDPLYPALLKDVKDLNANLDGKDLLAGADAPPAADTAPDFWTAWDGRTTREEDPMHMAMEAAEAERLKQAGEQRIAHDKLLATLMQHGLDENGEHITTATTSGTATTPTNPHYPVASSPSRPMVPLAPFFGAITSMFDTVSSVVGGITKVSNMSGKMVGALDRATGGDGMKQMVGFVLGLFSALLNFGVARGQRPAFATVEPYDPHGPYGPDPFPFQTPGSEKCHRMLTTWLAKCEH